MKIIPPGKHLLVQSKPTIETLKSVKYVQS